MSDEHENKCELCEEDEASFYCYQCRKRICEECRDCDHVCGNFFVARKKLEWMKELG